MLKFSMARGAEIFPRLHDEFQPGPRNSSPLVSKSSKSPACFSALAEIMFQLRRIFSDFFSPFAWTENPRAMVCKTGLGFLAHPEISGHKESFSR